ncbi:hypothetical protein M0R45_034998 [Rubus argutus]|uniref:Uncharacterized protein n=1 Tax=Rubus argutus TaxID=59490 RepID=A0AAW1VTG6_RUBAR
MASFNLTLHNQSPKHHTCNHQKASQNHFIQFKPSHSNLTTKSSRQQPIHPHHHGISSINSKSHHPEAQTTPRHRSPSPLPSVLCPDSYRTTMISQPSHRCNQEG